MVKNISWKAPKILLKITKPAFSSLCIIFHVAGTAHCAWSTNWIFESNSSKSSSTSLPQNIPRQAPHGHIHSSKIPFSGITLCPVCFFFCCDKTLTKNNLGKKVFIWCPRYGLSLMEAEGGAHMPTFGWAFLHQPSRKCLTDMTRPIWWRQCLCWDSPFPDKSTFFVKLAKTKQHLWKLDPTYCHRSSWERTQRPGNRKNDKEL